MNASNQVVVKKFIKALPDEIMRVIYSFALPVKPKVCDVCKTPCVKTHLLKSITGHLDRSSIIKGNLCNTCWCSRINYATIIKYNFLEKLEKHLYPTDTVIKEELKKRANKIAGEWRLIFKGKWLFEKHKQKKTQEKAVFYERLLTEGIKLHCKHMVRSIAKNKDLIKEPLRKIVLNKALALRFAEGRVSNEYFTRILRAIDYHYFQEKEMVSILANWKRVDEVKTLGFTYSVKQVVKWRTDETGILLFDAEVYKKNRHMEFCGYKNLVTNEIEYKY